MGPGASIAGVALATVLAVSGCSGGSSSGGSDDAGATPSASASATPVVTATTPRPTPTPPYPTGANGCYDNAKWTGKEAAAWLNLETYIPYGSGDPSITLNTTKAGYNGPLCQPVAVQVQFWTVTYAANPRHDGSVGSTDKSPDFFFVMKTVKRQTIGFDGRKAARVTLPPHFYDVKRSVCVGSLIAIYPGQPLSAKELPENITSGNNIIPTDVDFRTDRIADHSWSPPTAPQTCGKDGKPLPPPTTPGIPGIPGIPSLAPFPTLSPLK